VRGVRCSKEVIAVGRGRRAAGVVASPADGLAA
jgi:hypothetical protein